MTSRGVHPYSAAEVLSDEHGRPEMQALLSTYSAAVAATLLVDAASPDRALR